MMERQIGMLPQREPDYIKPFQVHVAESKWQFCNCKSCQDYRFLIECQPGKPVDFKTYRKKDEKY